MPTSAQLRERAAVIPTADGELRGTVLLPTPPLTAAALLLPGSGPINRDSDHRELPLAVTRLLAEVLAAEGIMTLRYDKRGVGKSPGDFWSTGMLQNVEDAISALRALRADCLASTVPVFVIGHGEGAALATAVATREPLDGLVLLSMAARSGRETLAWQAEVLQSEVPAAAKLLLRLLRIDLRRVHERRMARIMQSTCDSGRVGGATTNLRWFREFATFDPREHLRQLRIPVAAITGAKDLQAPPEDVWVVGQGTSGPFTGHLVDGVDHILRTEPGSPSVRGDRRHAAQPLDGRVVAHLVDFVTTTVSRGPTT